MYFLSLFTLKITESKKSMNGDKWEQTEQIVKADGMLYFGGEACVQILEDYFSKSKDDISFNNFYLIWHNDSMQI